MAQTRFVEIPQPDPIVRADAMLHVTFERRDAPQMARFLEAFGFRRVEHPGATLYFRGHGPTPYIVALRPSDRDALVGFAFAARSAQDLVTLAAATGASIVASDGPGGGQEVRLTDPSGWAVRLVHGFAEAEPVEVGPAPEPLNSPLAKPRVNRTVRSEPQPSPIHKFGHVVLQTPDFDGLVQWYMRHFGILPSDVQCLPDGRPMLGFFRLNRGGEPADHHSVAIADGPENRLMHVSFETYNVDGLGQGHNHLRAGGWTHYWGPGRHILGSQLFDYWKDPAGVEWEHYVDGDVMTEDYPAGYTPFTRGSLWAWGDDLPADVRPGVTLPEVEKLAAEGVIDADTASRLRGTLEAFAVPPRPWLT